MSTVPVQNAPITPVETVEERFRRLAALWEADTQFFSDPGRIINHPAFQEIIQMGEPVIPLMLSELAREPHLWVWALPRITGENPVLPAHAGNIKLMTEAWLRWGREHGYRW